MTPQPKSMMERLALLAILDNTRGLARGIKTLWDEYRVSSNSGSVNLAEIKKWIETTQESSINPKTKRYYAQNIHTTLFKFRSTALNQSAVLQKPDFSILAAMALMHHTLLELESSQQDTIDQQYELLCNCLMTITDSDMCYLVSQQSDNTYILATSGIPKKCLEHQATTIKLGEAISKSPNTDFSSLDYTSMVQSEDEKDEKFCLVPIPLYKDDNQSFYLVFQKNHITDSSPIPTIYQLRDALFLRGKLISTLKRDAHELVNLQKRRARLKPINDGEVRIFHISDLHIASNNYSIIRDNIALLGKDDDFQKIDADFMAITGDVIQGRDATADLQAHYALAAKVIRQLAFELWAKPFSSAELLSPTWKNRTLITTGNHDYASMNELKTAHGENRRSTGSGTPAQKEANVTAKFAYYIHFLYELLDIEPDNLFAQNLNDWRVYKAFHLGFLVLNTSFTAGPRRNNKVALDQKFLLEKDDILSAFTKAENNKIICLCHHSPKYHVNYVSDYYYTPYIEPDIEKQFIASVRATTNPFHIPNEEFRKKCQSIKETIDHHCTSNDEMPDLTMLLSYDSVQAYLEQMYHKEPIESDELNLPDIWDKMNKKKTDTDIYHHLTAFAGMDGANITLETSWKYYSDLFSVHQMSLIDQKHIEEYYEKISPYITTFLAGHTHKYRSYPEGVYEMNRFYRCCYKIPEDNFSQLKYQHSLHYGIFITNDNKGVTYMPKEFRSPL